MEFFKGNNEKTFSDLGSGLMASQNRKDYLKAYYQKNKKKLKLKAKKCCVFLSFLIVVMMSEGLR